MEDLPSWVPSKLRTIEGKILAERLNVHSSKKCSLENDILYFATERVDRKTQYLVGVRSNGTIVKKHCNVLVDTGETFESFLREWEQEADFLRRNEEEMYQRKCVNGRFVESPELHSDVPVDD